MRICIPKHCIITVRVSPVSVVQGMTCSSCVNLIESSLARLAGVHEVSVALTTERGRVRFDRALLGPRDILAAVNSLGFQVFFFSLIYYVPIYTERGRVRFDRALLGPLDILAAVNSLGFQVWFGFFSHQFICSTLSTVVFALTKRSVNPGTFFLSSTGSDSRFRFVYFLQIT
jgi:copper chaperone CopZ